MNMYGDIEYGDVEDLEEQEKETVEEKHSDLAFLVAWMDERLINFWRKYLFLLKGKEYVTFKINMSSNCDLIIIFFFYLIYFFLYFC